MGAAWCFGRRWRSIGHIVVLTLLGLTAAQEPFIDDVESFHQQGFLLKRGLLSSREMALVRTALETDGSLDLNAMRSEDDRGGFTKVIHLSRLDNGTLGLSLRLARLVRLLRALLGERGELMHWMTRIIHKLPGHGGEWPLHQDYSYWSQDGFRRPDMVTLYLAVDDQTMHNGPLRLLAGSQSMGPSGLSPQDSCVAQGTGCEELHVAKRRFPEYVPLLRSGDVIFISSLVYHSSSGNNSPRHRRALTAVYTRSDNTGDDGNCCRPVDEVDDTSLIDRSTAIGVDATTLLQPHGYVGSDAQARHGYQPM